MQNLYRQALQADSYLKQDLFAKKNLWDNDKTTENETICRKAEERYASHLWMIRQIQELILQDVIEEKGLLKNFAEHHKKEIFETLQKNSTTKEKMNYISVLLANFYHKYE
ncbi:MAG: hypothetical protein Q4C98_02455 [Capnocytophaga sp.]|nr:hypothetical protein [Capnocytophaga sp.]